jgi:hypothetical protein
MLMRAIKWDDGTVVALDERGSKIADLCGSYEIFVFILRRRSGSSRGGTL